MKTLLIGFLAMITVKTSYTQDFRIYEKHWFIQSGDTMPYRVLLPLSYDPDKKYPLVIFLHGRGESGSDNENQLTHGASLFLVDSIRKKNPCILVFPQCALNSFWSNVQMVIQGDIQGQRDFNFIPDGEPSNAMKLLLGLTDYLLVKYPIQIKQVYAMGLSMGGMGVFELVSRKPDLFAAAIPICGGAHPSVARKLLKVKWWVFHGARDQVVPVQASETMVKALKKNGAVCRFTVYPEVNHNSWNFAFAEKDLLSWLFSNRK